MQFEIPNLLNANFRLRTCSDRGRVWPTLSLHVSECGSWQQSQSCAKLSGTNPSGIRCSGAQQSRIALFERSSRGCQASGIHREAQSSQLQVTRRFGPGLAHGSIRFAARRIGRLAHRLGDIGVGRNGNIWLTLVACPGGLAVQVKCHGIGLDAQFSGGELTPGAWSHKRTPGRRQQPRQNGSCSRL